MEARCYFDQIRLLTPTISPSTNMKVAVFAILVLLLVSVVSANLDARAAKAAKEMIGQSSVTCPDHGVEGCACMVNRVLKHAGIRTIGSNVNYVPSVVQALNAGRGRRVSCSSADAGSIIVAHGEVHIGFCIAHGCSSVISNSSSRECFCWKSNLSAFNSYFHGESTCYEILN
ncbi:phage late control gene D protein GPD [Carpediemonas membranifera]|uniref:Phage late control gene D protein GPD n=1 Tax=Carpediemonas membranifera TaxID=201153 RepID=A0A8J6B2T6_9EUKA|nr:phage late control gene D protein GPD [Carpediemonas membranifera]|eukprot:KAG9397170.1 phage late control gene D protein GPD [Carpediemonas membranifera]